MARGEAAIGSSTEQLAILGFGHRAR